MFLNHFILIKIIEDITSNLDENCLKSIKKKKNHQYNYYDQCYNNNGENFLQILNVNLIK